MCMRSWCRAHGSRVVPGVNAARDDTELASKQTKLLENKLEMSYIKLNEAMGRNKLIREDIDNLRRERCVFEQVRCRAAPRAAYTALTRGLSRFTRSWSASCTKRSARSPASSTFPTSLMRLAIRHALRPERHAAVPGSHAPLSRPGAERDRCSPGTV